MDDRLCIVQFPHPGLEHEPRNGTGKPWNTGQHRRTFVLNRGRYVDADNNISEDELV